VRYRPLGASGLLVSEIALGAATFGEIADAEQAHAIVGAALDAGVNFFDTADVYCGGRSEEILGRTLRAHRDRVVISTKGGARVGDSEVDLAASHRVGGLDHWERWQRGIAPTDQGLSRRHLVDALDASLRRLGTDYLDVYTLHRFDPTTSIENVLDTLQSFVTAGKVRTVACSGWAAWRLTKANCIAGVRGTVRLEATQLPYNLLHRVHEAELIPACADQSVAVLVFQALAGGMLTGRYADGATPDSRSRMGSRATYRARYLTSEVRARVNAVARYAEQVGRSATELAVGWLLAQPTVTSVLFGASRVEQLGDASRTVAVPLTHDELAALEAALADESDPETTGGSR